MTPKTETQKVAALLAERMQAGPVIEAKPSRLDFWPTAKSGTQIVEIFDAPAGQAHPVISKGVLWKGIAP